MFKIDEPEIIKIIVLYPAIITNKVRELMNLTQQITLLLWIAKVRSFWKFASKHVRNADLSELPLQILQQSYR